MVLSIRHSTRYFLVKGRQVPCHVFILKPSLLTLLLGATLFIFNLVLQILEVAERMLPVLLSLLALELFNLLNIELESGNRLPLDLLVRRVEIIQHCRPLCMILFPCVFG